MEVDGSSGPDLDHQLAGGCQRPNEVMIWATRNFGELLDGIEAERSPCTTYWIGLPPVRDQAGRKTIPRGAPVLDRIKSMRAQGVKIHAMAEFHWWSYHAWVMATGKTPLNEVHEVDGSGDLVLTLDLR